MGTLTQLITKRRKTARELVEDHFVSWYVSESIANFLVVEERPREVRSGIINDAFDRLLHRAQTRRSLEQEVNDTFSETDLTPQAMSAIRDITWDAYKTLARQGLFNIEEEEPSEDASGESINEETLEFPLRRDISRLPPNGTLRKKVDEYFENKINHWKPVYARLVKALKIQGSQK